ncbi:hypothetical protein C1H46_009607 [Malus baccata]|uniref:Uncharacterized protein n=1 Tax=Malus baccata TaxID=106549 RepID=A0A540N154_MALBA|nr:hypothetical protein C1H46_009607 [Malus baccata]
MRTRDVVFLTDRTRDVVFKHFSLTLTHKSNQIRRLPHGSNTSTLTITNYIESKQNEKPAKFLNQKH